MLSYGACVQVLTEYTTAQLPAVLEALERMHAHLTAAVVSNDALFLQVSRARARRARTVYNRDAGRI